MRLELDSCELQAPTSALSLTFALEPGCWPPPRLRRPGNKCRAPPLGPSEQLPRPARRVQVNASERLSPAISGHLWTRIGAEGALRCELVAATNTQTKARFHGRPTAAKRAATRRPKCLRGAAGGPHKTGDTKCRPAETMGGPIVAIDRRWLIAASELGGNARDSLAQKRLARAPIEQQHWPSLRTHLHTVLHSILHTFARTLFPTKTHTKPKPITTH